MAVFIVLYNIEKNVPIHIHERMWYDNKKNQKNGDTLKAKRKMIPLSGRNQEFFQAFYEEQKEFLLYLAYRFTQNKGEQEDLIQETLLRLMKNTEVLRQLGREQTAKYIELTVKTSYLDIEQRKCKEKLILLDEAALEAMLRQTDTDSASEAVDTLRADLRDRDWAVLEGKYILGYSDQELSSIFGISANSMRSLLSRARRRARNILSITHKEGDV